MKNFESEVVKAISNTVLQGAPSVSENSEACLYRGPCGLKCVVGHMIPDDKYSKNMDKTSISGGLSSTAIGDNFLIKQALELSNEEVTILEVLQECHDRFTSQVSYVQQFTSNFKSSIKFNVEQGDLPKYCLEGLS